ncbi:MAG TPA: hypothetical protein VFB78_10915 [Acidimicrobiales bacterium]|nr:hypothetical protein [Acidimicrobiales bacterium]
MADVAQETTASGRLGEAIGGLRISAVRARVSERTLLYVGGALGILGLAVVLIGWYGVSHTIVLQEQNAYIVSGGLLGLGLVFLGGFSYFAYWVTRLVQEQQRQTTVLLEAITSLRPSANGGAPAAAVVGVGVGVGGLVATAKGSMAHRPDCAAVAGKKGLRKVTEATGLEPCRLCNPY